MAYKVMGVAAGRKNGNSEILLKQALLACQDGGSDVTLINLRDFSILDCTGCTVCSEGMARGKHVPCSLLNKDDKDKIMQVMLNQDGVIFSVPTYDLTPASNYLTFAHRNLAYETAFLQHIGAIEYRDRVAGLIAVGGSMYDWQSMALPGLQATAFTNSFQVVDMLLARQCPSPAQCLLNDDLMNRAYRMGENIIKAINTPPKDRRWLGDEDEGWCPNCHSSALVQGHPHWDGVQWPIECAVCGAGGNLEKTPEGKWKFVIAPDGLIRDRTTNEGREHHLREIGQTHGKFYQPENRAIVNEKIKKYKDLSFKGL
jgi:multimeric flavodoxin WrbA